MTYGMYKRLAYLKEKGFSRSRNIVETSNAASIKVHEKFPCKKYARVHAKRFLWWYSWKETAL
jgi:hypothetical protein